MDWAVKAAGGLFGLVFPDDCRLCGQPLRHLSRIPVCPACIQDVEPLAAEYYCARCHTPFLNPRPLDSAGVCGLCRLGLVGYDDAYSYGPYEGALRELIHLLKYEGVTPLAAPLGSLLARAVPRDRAFDLIVPMPLHWRRRWQRGFNQSELLCRQLARRLGLPVVDAVSRRRGTGSQTGLSHAQRRANVNGAFRPRRASIRGKRILLVDDVLTTGATASACAAVLKSAGAPRVTVLTLARTDRRAWVAVPANAGRQTHLAWGSS